MIRAFGVALATLLVAMAARPAAGDTSRGALRVSVQVTRPCRVVRSADQVSLGCGSRPQRVQVTQAGRTTVRTVAGSTSVAPNAGQTVTVEF